MAESDENAVGFSGCVSAIAVYSTHRTRIAHCHFLAISTSHCRISNSGNTLAGLFLQRFNNLETRVLLPVVTL
jgi:hypothetical protein